MQITQTQYDQLIAIDAKCINPMFTGLSLQDVQARIDEGLQLKTQRQSKGESLTKEQKDNVLLVDRLPLLDML
jgi:hypothetical protein